LPPRATGLLVIEVRNSSPGGPGRRKEGVLVRADGRGWISPFSLMERLRDLVHNKQGPVWRGFAGQFSADLDIRQFQVSGRDSGNAEGRGRAMDRFWDIRVFGQGEGMAPDRDSVVRFGLGLSVCPVRIAHAGAGEPVTAYDDQGRGKSATGRDDRVVTHGVYAMPFFINPTAAVSSGCRPLDIELLLRLIPWVYSHTGTVLQSAVCLRHAWYMEHTSFLGSCVDLALIDALTPVKKGDPEESSSGWTDYQVPRTLPRKLQARVKSLRDLVEEQMSCGG